jgi:hypothetical protein
VSVVCVTICDAVSATPDPTPVPVFPDKIFIILLSSIDAIKNIAKKNKALTGKVKFCLNNIN